MSVCSRLGLILATLAFKSVYLFIDHLVNDISSRLPAKFLPFGSGFVLVDKDKTKVRHQAKTQNIYSSKCPRHGDKFSHRNAV